MFNKAEFWHNVFIKKLIWASENNLATVQGFAIVQSCYGTRGVYKDVRWTLLQSNHLTAHNFEHNKDQLYSEQDILTFLGQ